MCACAASLTSTATHVRRCRPRDCLSPRALPLPGTEKLPIRAAKVGGKTVLITTFQGEAGPEPAFRFGDAAGTLDWFLYDEAVPAGGTASHWQVDMCISAGAGQE